MVSSVPAVMPVGSNWVGNLTFVETVKSELGSRAIYRAVEHSERDYTRCGNKARLTAPRMSAKMNGQPDLDRTR